MRDYFPRETEFLVALGFRVRFPMICGYSGDCRGAIPDRDRSVMSQNCTALPSCIPHTPQNRGTVNPPPTTSSLA